MSKTETAIAGLVAVLTAAAGDAFPAPSRNESLLTAAKPFGNLAASFNVWDGAGAVDLERSVLGADDAGVEGGYYLNQRPTLELMFEGGTGADRDAAIDAALLAIDDALKADRTLVGALGDEGFAAIEAIEREGSGLVTEGMAGAKGVVVTVLLQFSSNRPF